MDQTDNKEAKLIDLFGGKRAKFKPRKDPGYFQRNQECNLKIIQSGICTCDTCKAKVHLANKLAQISRWLLLDYAKKNNVNLYNGDWMDVVQDAFLVVHQSIYPDDKL